MRLISIVFLLGLAATVTGCKCSRPCHCPPPAFLASAVPVPVTQASSVPAPAMLPAADHDAPRIQPVPAQPTRTAYTRDRLP